MNADVGLLTVPSFDTFSIWRFLWPFVWNFFPFIIGFLIISCLYHVFCCVIFQSFWFVIRRLFDFLFPKIYDWLYSKLQQIYIWAFMEKKRRKKRDRSKDKIIDETQAIVEKTPNISNISKEKEAVPIKKKAKLDYKKIECFIDLEIAKNFALNTKIENQLYNYS